MADGSLTLPALWAVSLLGALATASRCHPDKGDDTGDSPSVDTDESGGHHCVDDSDSEPPDSTQPDTAPDSGDSLPPDSPPDSPADTGPATGCPEGMVPVGDALCIDVYEASHPDATATATGTDASRATSRAGVQVWRVSSVEEADAACAGAGKRLCTVEEWTGACRGPADTTYAYGDTYEATTCNGIDTGCDCGSTSQTCECDAHGGPYSGCYYDCGGSMGVAVSGAFPGCTNGYGVFDMNGNVWEYVVATDPYPVRGGAYNCGDSASYHQCDYVPGWDPSARGFRCCADREG